MIVEVMELPKELLAASVFTFKNLQVTARIGIAVFEYLEEAGVRLDQKRRSLVVLRSFASEEDAVDLGISKLLSRLEHDVVCSYRNLLAHFYVSNLVALDLRPHWVIWALELVLHHRNSCDGRCDSHQRNTRICLQPSNVTRSYATVGRGTSRVGRAEAYPACEGPDWCVD